MICITSKERVEVVQLLGVMRLSSGRTAMSFDDDGNWRCRRVSDLSRYRQAQIGAA